MPYSNGPRKKSGKIVTISAFIAEPATQFSVLSSQLSALSSQLSALSSQLSALSSQLSFAVDPFLSKLFLSPRLRLLPLLFRCHRSVDFQQAFRQFHAHLLPPHVHAVEIRLSERNFH